MGVLTDREKYLASGVSAEGRTTPRLDIRVSNGTFFMYFSGSGNGPSAGASAIFSLQHSHDLTAWSTIAQYTASGDGVSVVTAMHSGGAYGYLSVLVDKVYSAAQTGTGSLWLHARAGQP